MRHRRNNNESRRGYASTGDVDAARRLSNRDLSPHLSFVDMGGHRAPFRRDAWRLKGRTP